MFETKYGDMFSEARDAYAHGVNVDGAMGAGVAALVSDYWPELYDAYCDKCLDGSLAPGGMFPYLTSNGWVYNCASQDRPGPCATEEWLESSLRKAYAHMELHGLRTLSLPLIGGGIGGIDPARAQDIIHTLADQHGSVHTTLWLYP